MLYRILYSFWFVFPDGVKANVVERDIIRALLRLKFLHNTTIEVI
jgi:hypothetical protein